MTASAKQQGAIAAALAGLTPTHAAFAVAVTAVLASLDLTQLVGILIGAVAYGLLQLPRKAAKKARPTLAKGVPGPKGARGGPKPGGGGSPQRSREPAPPKPEVRQVSNKPVSAPQFAADDFQGQMEELLAQITPTAESERFVKDISRYVKGLLEGTLPEAEVMSFASSAIGRGTAFGVAVPECDIIVHIPPQAIMTRLQNRLVKDAKIDPRKLQKSAIRACTELLVGKGGFKFRRSAFRGREPKVTLVSPPSSALPSGIPVDFSVNGITPLHNAVLLTECGQLDRRAKALILAVRRWAKDRAICHASKGHLAPYAWSVLVIFFMQVRTEGAPLLPPLDGFKVSGGLSVKRSAKQEERAATWQQPAGRDAELTVAQLFAEFIRFYAKTMDWRREGASVRLGRRAEPGLRMELHIVDEDGTSEVAPSIEDPFDVTRNLGDTMTSHGLHRLREELARATDLCAQDARLDVLLEPWVPPLGPEDDNPEEVEEALK